jgi:hypothetical protein
MFRFTIRDLMWLTVFVALGSAWLYERKARQVAEQDRTTAEFLYQGLERGVEDEGYRIAGFHLGYAELVQLAPDFPKGLPPAEKRLRLRELMGQSGNRKDVD